MTHSTEVGFARADHPTGIISWIRSTIAVARLTLGRLIWSTNTLMALFPIVITTFVFARRHLGLTSYKWDLQSISDAIINTMFVFVAPITAVAYGSAALGADREDRTLVYLVIRPIHLGWMLLTKYAVGVTLACGLVFFGFRIITGINGQSGSVAWDLYAWPLMLATAAYSSLFLLMSVLFRHATIVALLYTFFLEMVIGNMPGIVKRVAISYYSRNLAFNAGSHHGLSSPPATFFEPLSTQVATNCLYGFIVGCLLLAMVVFSTREYRDLT